VLLAAAAVTLTYGSAYVDDERDGKGAEEEEVALAAEDSEIADLA